MDDKEMKKNHPYPAIPETEISKIKKEVSKTYQEIFDSLYKKYIDEDLS